jgi:signal transduction histidine kinase
LSKELTAHMDEADEISELEHEWRTSVTAIRAAAEILRDYDGLATPEHDRFVQAIIQESGRLSSAFEKVSESPDAGASATPASGRKRAVSHR